ncbi:hypothetical protein [Ancylobacter terrae]|uniref:hypothetical protein n=1 Tax=Ancylobacter sp. sgz301288 TaxID=3342077 RepID=UPI00385C4727
MSLILNERLKLMANALNAVAVTLIAGGSIAPVGAYIYGTAHLALDIGYVLAASVLCLTAAVVLHCIGLGILGWMRP